MLSAKAQHPNCAYMWMKWVSTPKVQAQQAISFGETPANTKACPIMDQLQKGSCAQYHANAPASYFNSIKFWKTPIARLRQRQDRTAPTTRRGSRSGRRSRARAGREPSRRRSRPGRRGWLSAALFRRPWLRAPLLLRRRCWFVADLPARAGRAVHLGVLAHGRRSPASSSATGTSTTSGASSSDPTYRTIALRTIGIAAAVTVDRRAAGAPVRLLRGAPGAARALQTALFVIVLLPLWTSYLVRVYAWRLILAKDGILNWTLEQLGFGSRQRRLLELGDVDRVQLHLAAVHDPAGVARRSSACPTPSSRRRADLGARGWTTFRRVVLPLVLPGRRRRLDLHVLADARRLHHADAGRRRRLGLHRQRRLPQRRDRQQRAVRGGVRDDPAGW